MGNLDQEVRYRPVGMPALLISVVLLGMVAALNITSTVLALLAA